MRIFDGKHGYSSRHDLSIGDAVARHIGPPRVYGIVRRPLGNIEGDAEPLLDQPPNSYGEAALEEKVGRRFLC